MKLYKELLKEMYGLGITQAFIGEQLGYKSSGAISQRFNGKQHFTINEGYKILTIIVKPYLDFTKYFPPVN